MPRRKSRYEMKHSQRDDRACNKWQLCRIREVRGAKQSTTKSHVWRLDDCYITPIKHVLHSIISVDSDMQGYAKHRWERIKAKS
jgi:hypothetical protein